MILDTEQAATEHVEAVGRSLAAIVAKSPKGDKGLALSSQVCAMQFSGNPAFFGFDTKLTGLIVKIMNECRDYISKTRKEYEGKVFPECIEDDDERNTFLVITSSFRVLYDSWNAFNETVLKRKAQTGGGLSAEEAEALDQVIRNREERSRAEIEQSAEEWLENSENKLKYEAKGTSKDEAKRILIKSMNEPLTEDEEKALGIVE